jgi:hypothetical protein
VTHYGLNSPGSESQWGGEIFHTCPDRPWGPPSLLYSGYRVFPGVKWLGHGIDHSPPSGAEVKESVESVGLYLYSPSGPLCCVLGWPCDLVHVLPCDVIDRYTCGGWEERATWILKAWLTDCMTDWLSDWLTDWLTAWLTVWLTDCMTDCLHDWLTAWLTVWLTDWLTDWLTRHYKCVKIKIIKTTAVPPYPWVIRSKTYCGYMKLRLILNTVYDVIFV